MVGLWQHASPELLALELGQRLLARQWRLATAESCTGGGLAYAITAVAGSSGWFDQGVVAYANSVKQQLLAVPEPLLATHGAVSAPVVVAMAEGVRRSSGAQLAVATSGIAGPGGGTSDKPVGLVWFGFALDGQCHAEQRLFAGSRDQVRTLAIRHAVLRLNQICEAGQLDTV